MIYKKVIYTIKDLALEVSDEREYDTGERDLQSLQRPERQRHQFLAFMASSETIEH